LLRLLTRVIRAAFAILCKLILALVFLGLLARIREMAVLQRLATTRWD
jgi:hypothetical protein